MASKSNRTCAPSVCPNCRVHAMYVCVCVCVCACVRVYVCAHKFVFVRTTAAPAQALSLRDHIYLSLSPSLSSARALFPSLPSLSLRPSLSLPPFSLSLTHSLDTHTHALPASPSHFLSLTLSQNSARSHSPSLPPSQGIKGRYYGAHFLRPSFPGH